MTNLYTFSSRLRRLILSCLLLICSVGAWAYNFEYDGIEYNINADGTTVTVVGPNNYNKSTLNIPETVTYNGVKYSVTAIGKDAFNQNGLKTDRWGNCKSSFKATKVIIPKTVTQIYQSAFKYCCSITELVLSEGLEQMGAGCFEACKGLTSVTLPKSLKVIDAHSFKNCPNLCYVVVLAPPASLSTSGCSSSNDHCDWFNSRNEDCIKIGQTCDHCENAKLTVPVEYYEEYYKNEAWNYEFDNIYSDYDLSECLSIKLGDKVYDGTNALGVTNLEWNASCNYFSEDFLYNYLFEVTGASSSGVDANEGANPGYTGSITIQYRKKVGLKELSNKIIKGYYHITRRPLVVTGSVPTVTVTYNGSSTINKSKFDISGLSFEALKTDSGVVTLDEGEVALEVADDVTLTSANAGEYVDVPLVLKLIGDRSSNYKLACDTVKVKVIVKPRDITLSCDNINDASKTYDGSTEFTKSMLGLDKIDLTNYGVLDTDKAKLKLDVIANTVSADAATYTNTAVKLYFTGDNSVKKNYGLEKQNKEKPFLTCSKTLTITPREIKTLSYTFKVSDHTYDCLTNNAADVSITSFSFGKDEVISSETTCIELKVSNAVLASPNVGSNVTNEITFALGTKDNCTASVKNYQLTVDDSKLRVTTKTNVVPATLTISGTPTVAAHTYDGTTDNTKDVSVAGISLSGFSCNETVTTSCKESTMSQKNATVTQCGDKLGSATSEVIVKFDGVKLKNYTIDGATKESATVWYKTYSGITTTINQKAANVTISPTFTSRVYNAKVDVSANTTLNANFAGKIAGDDAEVKLVSAKMNDKTAGDAKSVNVVYTLDGADKNNYYLDSNCSESVTKKNAGTIKITQYGVEVGSLGFNSPIDYQCGTSLGSWSSGATTPSYVDLPDGYQQTDDAGTVDCVKIYPDNISLGNVVYNKTTSKYEAPAQITWKVGPDNCGDSKNYAITGGNKSTKTVTLNVNKDLVTIDPSAAFSTSASTIALTHSYDCKTDVTEDYKSSSYPQKIYLSGFCDNSLNNSVYYEIEKAEITDGNANVGSHETKLTFALHKGSMTSEQQKLYGLEDYLYITSGTVLNKKTISSVKTSVTAATGYTAVNDAAVTKLKLAHAYDGTTTLSNSENSSVPQKLELSAKLPSCCGSVYYELKSVILNNRNVGERTTTLTYTLKASDQDIINLGLTNNKTKTYTVATTVTAKKLTVTPSMAKCHTYNESTVISESEITTKVSGICTPNNTADDVAVKFLSATLSDANADTGKTVTVKYTLTGADAGNYTIDSEYTIANVEVCQAVLEVKGSLTFSEHTYDCSTDVTENAATYPYVEIDGKKIYLKFDTNNNDGATIGNKNVGSGKTVNAWLSLVGDYSNYKLQGSASQRVNIKTSTINVVARELTLDGTGSAKGREYNCSTDYDPVLITVPGLNGVQSCDKNKISVVVSKATLGNANAGTQTLTVVYALTGETSNYKFEDNKKTISVEISQKTASYTFPSEGKTIAYSCDATGTNVFTSVGYNTTTYTPVVVSDICESGTVQYVLQSAVLTDGTLDVPGTYTAELTYKLSYPSSFKPANYTNLDENKTVKLTTIVGNPSEATYTKPDVPSVTIPFSCGWDGKVADLSKYSSVQKINVNNDCWTSGAVYYNLKSVEVVGTTDYTPGTVDVKLAYELVNNSGRKDLSIYGITSSWNTLTLNGKVTIEKPKAATVASVPASNQSIDFDCGKTTDVTGTYQKISGFKTLAVTDDCNYGVYYELQKAVLTDADLTPHTATTNNTELTYKLNTSKAPATYSAADWGLSEIITRYAKTSINAKNVTVSLPKQEGTYTYGCSNNSLDVTSVYNNDKYNVTVPSDSICQTTGVYYYVTSAKVKDKTTADIVPGAELETILTYALHTPAGFVASDYGLKSTLTGYATTKVGYPEAATYTFPDFNKIIEKKFDCANPSGDVTVEYQDEENGYGKTVTVNNVCDKDVYYELTEAKIIGTTDYTPANGFNVQVTYTLNTTKASSFVPSYYGITDADKTKVFTVNGLTNIIFTPTVTINTPEFSNGSYTYKCDDDGSSIEKLYPKSFDVEGVCGSNEIKYVLKSATFAAGDTYTPGDHTTTLVYKLNVDEKTGLLPGGYDPEDYGLENDITKTYQVTTTITKDDISASVEGVKPALDKAASRTYKCNDDGDVTDVYKSLYKGTKDEVNFTHKDLCSGTSFVYELTKAQIDGNDFTPAENMPTTVTYTIKSTGVDYNYYNLPETFTVASKTTLEPIKATFTEPTFTTVEHTYDCSDKGDVSADYQKESLSFYKIKVDAASVCDANVYYTIKSAVINDGNYAAHKTTSANTTVTYELNYDKSFVPNDYSLKTTLTYKTAKTDIVAPTLTVTPPAYYKTLSRDYICDDKDRDVTSLYQADEVYKKFTVGTYCGETLYYEVEKAKIDGSDFTPAEDLATTVTYKLAGYQSVNPVNLGLDKEIEVSGYKTTINKLAVSYSDPAISGKKRTYSCDDTKDVTSLFPQSIALSGSCNSKAQYKLTSATITSAAITPGTVDVKLIYDFDEAGFGYNVADFVFADGTLLSNKLQLTYATTITIEKPAQINLSTVKPNFTTVNHEYECDEDGDVTKEYQDQTPGIVTFTAATLCNQTITYTLKSAQVTAADKTPADGLATKFTFARNEDPTDFDPDQYGLTKTLTFDANTTNITARTATINWPSEFTATLPLLCDDSYDLLNAFAAYNEVSVSDVCSVTDVKYVLKSVKFKSDNISSFEVGRSYGVTLDYELELSDAFSKAGFVASDFTLSSSIEKFGSLTIKTPDPVTVTPPTFATVSHKYVCNDDENVLSDYTDYSKFTVEVCNKTVTYTLNEAKIYGAAVEPGKTYSTYVVYKRQLGNLDEKVADAFGLAETITYATDASYSASVVVIPTIHTEVTNDAATFEKPEFSVTHTFDCNIADDVLTDYKSYAEIPVSGVCAVKDLKYVLESANLTGSNRNPGDKCATTLVYKLSTTEGYAPAVYGLKETLTYTDVITTIGNPSSIKVSEPEFTNVEHQYVCNEDGNVLGDYQSSAFSTIKVKISDACGTVTYKVKSAQISSTESLKPSETAKKTTVVYELDKTSYSGFDPVNWYNLPESITYTDKAKTVVTAPDKATFTEPNFPTLDYTYTCNFDGNLKSEYQAEITVNDPCNADVKYTLTSAQIADGNTDYTPSSSRKVHLVYTLQPADYDWQLYGLTSNKLEYDAYVNITKPDPAEYSEPTTYTALDHTIICDENGDVLSEYLNSAYKTITVSNTCDGDKVYYQITKAQVYSADGTYTTRDNQRTTLTYTLQVPAGVDAKEYADDYSIAYEFTTDKALTDINPMDSQHMFDDPVFSTVTHDFECGDDGVVTDEYKAAGYGTIAVTGTCKAKFSYEIEEAKIDGDDFHPATDLSTTVKYKLVYDNGVNPAEYGLSTELTYNTAKTTINVVATPTITAPTFTAVKHQWRCNEDGDVLASYTSDGTFATFTVPADGKTRCDDLVYALISAKINTGVYTPGTTQATTVVYELQMPKTGYYAGKNEQFINDYSLASVKTLTYDDAQTAITNPDQISVTFPTAPSVARNFDCDNTKTDVKSLYEDANYGSVAVGEICGSTVSYELTSATLTGSDFTPTRNGETPIETKLVYTLTNMPAGLDPTWWGLSSNTNIEVTGYTTINYPAAGVVSYNDPDFANNVVEHTYDCNDNGYVTTDYQKTKYSAINTITVTGVCSADVKYTLAEAKIDGDTWSPVATYPTTVTYKLNVDENGLLPGGYDPADFGLDTLISYNGKALTTVVKANGAKFEDPALITKIVIAHTYSCEDDPRNPLEGKTPGDVLNDYKAYDNGKYAVLKVEGICGDVKYVMDAAQIVGSDFTPSGDQSLQTNVHYTLYDGDTKIDASLAEFYGLDTEKVYTNFYTIVNKPAATVTVVDKPVFTGVELSHQYTCDFTGDVTDDYRAYNNSQLDTISVTNSCGIRFYYLLHKAQIDGSDFTPTADGEPLTTTLTYELQYPAGYDKNDADDYGLSETISFSSAYANGVCKTNIAKPAAGEVNYSQYDTVEHEFDCDEDGDVFADYTADALNHKYDSLAVSNVCAPGAYYKLVSANVTDKSDLTPAVDKPTTLVYNLVLVKDENGNTIDASDFGLESTVTVTTAKTTFLGVDGLSYGEPSTDDIQHQYSCDFDGDVKEDIEDNTAFTPIAVTGFSCSNIKLEYRLETAQVDGSDFTPGDDKSTTLTYNLYIEPNNYGYDAADFGLAPQITFTRYTDINKPDGATFKTPVNANATHVYGCDDNSNVYGDYVANYGTIKVTTAICGAGDVYYQLDSAKIVETDLTPSSVNKATKLYYSLQGITEKQASDYSLELNIEVDAQTNVDKPSQITVTPPTFETIEHKYACGDKGDVTSEYEDYNNGANATLSASETAICSNDIHYELVEAQIQPDANGVLDVTPTGNSTLSTTLKYHLVLSGNLTYDEAKIYGLDEYVTFDNYQTQITNPDTVKFTVNFDSNVTHEFECTEDGDVTSEYQNSSEYGNITLSDICGYPVVYSVTNATITATDKTPASDLETSVTYELQIPASITSEEEKAVFLALAKDFGLEETKTFNTAKTTISKPDAAEIVPLVYNNDVEHSYDCDDDGNVYTDYRDFENGKYNTVTVSNACNLNFTYTLTSAQISEGDFTPGKYKTTLTYILDLDENGLLPGGYEPSDFGFTEQPYTYVVDDVYTTVYNAVSGEPATPDFSGITHVYACGEQGDVTNDYNGFTDKNGKSYAMLSISGVCSPDIYYKLDSARIVDADLTPDVANAKSTKVCYSLVGASDKQIKDFDLKQNLEIDAETIVLSPDKATYTVPMLPVVTHKYVCGDDGDIKEDYLTADATLKSFSIEDNFCSYDAYYELDWAKITAEDKTPSGDDKLSAQVVYKLHLPEGITNDVAHIYGLKDSLIINTSVQVTNPDQVETNDITFDNAVNHDFECVEDGNVTTDYQASEYNKILYATLCGNDVYYEVTEAYVTDADKTPGDNRTTTVEYQIVLPDGYTLDDVKDFGLTETLAFDYAKTNIGYPVPAEVQMPDDNFATAIEHNFECGDDGNVTTEFRGSIYGTLNVTGVCDQTVTYTVKNAQILGEDFSPSDGRLTKVLYELNMSAGYDSTDFGLKANILIDYALTKVNKPAGATFNEPQFHGVTHQYSCDDTGDATEDYAKNYGDITISGICGDEAMKYVLDSAVIRSEDLTPDADIAKATDVYYRLVYVSDGSLVDAKKAADYSLDTIKVYTDVETIVTVADMPDYTVPDFDLTTHEVVAHKYECPETGDVTEEYEAISEYARIDVDPICGNEVYYVLDKAWITETPKTPSETPRATTVRYTLVMPDGYDAADFQLPENFDVTTAQTIVTNPDSAVVADHSVPAITHTFNCAGDVEDDFTGDKTIVVTGICGTNEGDVYYELTSAVINDENDAYTPGQYTSTLTYTLRGVPDSVNIAHYGLISPLVYSDVETTIEPKTVETNCYDITVNHTFNCSTEFAEDLADVYKTITISASELCGTDSVYYELVSAELASDQDEKVGDNKPGVITYKLKGLDLTEAAYYSLSEYKTCEATVSIKTATTTYTQPTVPSYLTHTYNCSGDVKSEYLEAGGTDSIPVDGLCSAGGNAVYYQLDSVKIQDEAGSYLPSVTPYNTVATYTLVGMNADDAALYDLPTSFTKETDTNIASDKLDVTCPDDLLTAIKHTYNSGADVTNDYTGETEIDIDVCSKEVGTVKYTLSYITIDDATNVSAGNGHATTAVFTLSGLTDEEQVYYGLSSNYTCATTTDVVATTIKLGDDAGSVSRDYNGSKDLDADNIILPSGSYYGPDSSTISIPSDYFEFVSGELDNKNAGSGKTATVTFKIKDEYADNFKFDNGETTITITVDSITINKLKIELDGDPTLTPKVNDGSTNISEDNVVLPNITNVKSDDNGNLDDVKLKYDSDNSYINGSGDHVSPGDLSATITLGIEGDDADNYYLSPDVWNDVKITVEPVELTISGNFSTTELRDYNGKTGLDITKISVPDLLYPDGTVVDPSVAKIVVTKAELVTKDAGVGKQVVIEYTISSTDYAFDSGETTGVDSTMTINVSRIPAILNNDIKVFADSKTYDCHTEVEPLLKPQVDNAQTNDEGVVDDIYAVTLRSEIDDPNVGFRKAEYQLTIAGADTANYYLLQELWTDSLYVRSRQLTLDSLDVKLDTHVYDCSKDVMGDFADKTNVMKITDGLADCESDAYLELVSATLNNSNAGSRKTTLTFQLVGADEKNYGLTFRELVKEVDTEVLPAKLEFTTEIVIDSITYNGTTGVTDQVIASGQVPNIIGGLSDCDKDATFKVVSAEVDNSQPGGPRTIKIVYTLDGADGNNYGLTENDTIFNVTTTIVPKEIGSIGTPEIPTHEYDGTTDVLKDYISASVPVLDGVVEGDDVHLEIVSAELSDPNVGEHETTVTYKLVGDDAWKYTLSDSVFTVTTLVTPKPITPNNDAVVAPRDYDATNNVYENQVTVPTVDGILDIDKDDVNVTFESGKLDDKEIGDRTATLTLTLTGDKASNYVLVPDTVQTPTSIIDSRHVLTFDGEMTIATRPYDGTTYLDDAYITLPNLIGIAPEDMDSVFVEVDVAYIDDPNAGTRTAYVTVKLTGPRADFYKLDNYELTAEVEVTPIAITLAGDVTVDSREENGSHDIDSNLIHLPGLDGVLTPDLGQVEAVVTSAKLDNAKAGDRTVTIDIALTGDKAGNYILVGVPVDAEVHIKVNSHMRQPLIPKYYSLEGRFIGEGEDFKPSFPGFYIKVTGRHAERVLIH